MTLQRASLLGLPLLVRLSHLGVFQASKTSAFMTEVTLADVQ